MTRVTWRPARSAYAIASTAHGLPGSWCTSRHLGMCSPRSCQPSQLRGAVSVCREAGAATPTLRFARA